MSSTVPVFLAEDADLSRDRFALGGSEGRHAAVVRRMRAGERVDVTDGAGLVARCVVVGADRDGLELEVAERLRRPAPEPRLTVVQALPKGDRGELAVEVLTEAGVDAVVPWAAARCVTQWRPDRREKALGRWRSAAREAAKQARRAWLPEVTDLATTRDVAARISAADLAVVLHEGADARVSGLAVPGSGEIVVVVGPEGGLTDDELAAFAAAGGVAAVLGSTILRTSTAGVACAAVLFSRCGRW